MLIILTGFLFYIFMKSDSSPTQPTKELLQQEEEEKQREDIETEDHSDESAEVAVREDPVREFLSDKLKKAADFFFTQDVKVVTLGDSLTEGIGDETNNSGYVGILDDTINRDKQVVEFQNFAKRGSRSGQLLSRLEDDEVIHAIEKADIVLITIGANDIMQVFKENFTDLTLEKFTSEQIRYEHRLEAIFSTIRKTNGEADVYLIGFYNPFKEYFKDIEELEYIVNNWNQIGYDVTNKFDQIYFIPIKDIFDDAEANYFSDDNFHPSALGYRLIAKRVLQYVLNEGESNDQTEATTE